MPVTTTELWESRTGGRIDAAGRKLVYLIEGTNDDAEALDQLITDSPSEHDELTRNAVTLDQRVSATAWLGSARYGPLDDQTGSYFSFDTGGGTQHVTQSIQTISKYTPIGVAPADYKGAINVTKDAVRGVDIAVPVYNFAETHYLPTETVTAAYKQYLYRLTARYNEAQFREFPAGEVLFLGATGSYRQRQENWEISFRFAASENRTDIQVGEIGPISKLGWEYMWIAYADFTDDIAIALVKKPIQANIERVYQPGDFSGLPAAPTT